MKNPSSVVAGETRSSALPARRVRDSPESVRIYRSRSVGVALRRLDTPSAALWVLVGSAALDHFSFQVGKLTVYPENVALGIVAPLFAYAVLTRRAPWIWPLTTLPLAGWLLISLLSSALNAPQRGHSLILWNKLLFVVVTYLIVVNLVRRRPLAGIRAQITTAAAAAGYAVLAFAAWKVVGTHWGMEHAAGNMGRSWLPQGTLREPDILGSFAGASALLGLAIALGPRGSLKEHPSHLSPWLRRSGWAAFILCSFAVAVSGARTAWLAFAACLAVAAVHYLAGRSRRQLLKFAPVVVLLVGVVGLVAILRPAHGILPKFQPSQNGSLVQRLASFSALNKERDLTVREEIYQNALAHWRKHPWIGWGVGAYGESFRYPPPDQGHPGWISNLPIHVLYDSGLIGLLFFGAALVLSAWRGISAWRDAKSVSHTLLGGILLGLLALLLAFQATEATWFAYPWVFLGILEGILSRRQPGISLRGLFSQTVAILPGVTSYHAQPDKACASR